ncbi:CPBP family intramembrane glutamic endopeptidase [Spirosoma agri]|uniref:CPBP family intramembrane metalloprotease n=1 Tax=Spirosoma agri TaxID=1987381 RepID=A0A6M0IQ61_9BACT|nr:CPBP family intramembrane glutamic endopeptidase [Spirosoma agri]NEU70418.1 CPBP family intramembrane metalloprotease [Spirosoma agri]
MSAYQFSRILLINCLLIIAVNGLFYWQFVKTLVAQRQIAILFGLAIYFIQIIVTYLLAGDQKIWLTQPFKGKTILQGLGAIIVVEVLTTMLLSTFTTHAHIFSLTDRLPSFFLLFILNSLPGAILEEWIFRYLPLRFSQQFKKDHRTILLCIGSLILFTLIHIPAYIFQYEHSLSELSRVFMMGLFFLVVYVLTQNLFFTVLFHGLTNNPLYLVESPYYWLYFYGSTVVVSGFWALQNWRNRHRSISL